jgi:hypothetical protein
VAMQNGGVGAQSSATRIMILGYGALAVVLLNCYVANLTALLTVNRIRTSIASIDELQGKAVGTTKVR